jgi:signal transduction histidine kinase/CheY-like chemotaxis protein
VPRHRAVTPLNKKAACPLLLAVAGLATGLSASPLAGQSPFGLPTPVEPIASVIVDRDGDAVPDRVGDTVTVRGVALSAAGALFPDRFNLAIRDSTASVVVFGYEIEAPVARGDTVTVRGELVHFQGLTQVTAARYEVGGRGDEPRPVIIEPPIPGGEELEGRLVRVVARILQVGRNAGGPYLIVQPLGKKGRSLTVFARASARHADALLGFRVGDRVEVTAVMGQFDTEPPYTEGYQLYPRTAADLVYLGASRAWLGKAAAVGLVALLAVLMWSFSLRRQVAAQTRELRESERQARLLMEQAPGAVVVHAGEELLYANADAGVLLGAPAEGGVLLTEFLDQESARTLSGMGPNTGSEATESAMGAKLGTLDGRDIDVEMRAVAIRYHGRVAQLLWVQDVTERIRRDEQRRSMEVHLQERRRLETLGELAGGIAHDFNNLLVGIMGNAALVVGQPYLKPDDHELLGEVLKASRRAEHLTRQMLSFAGKAGLSPEPLDLAQLVKESLPLLQSGEGRRAEIEIQASGEAWARCDRAQVQDLLVGIVANAREALDGGPGAIRIVTATELVTSEGLEVTGDTLSAGRYARLTVDDEGPGMDDGTMQRVFDPFFTTKFLGRGLGLASALGVVRGHGGGIRLRSAPGEGTCVDVFLPSTDAPGTSVRAGSTRRECGPILVVDDEAHVRALAVRVLERAGYQTMEAEDGHAALAVVARERVGAVVLDVTMPGIDGTEVLWRLRSDRAELPVVLSSGFSNEDWGVEDDPFTALLAKPYTPQALVDIVERFASRDSGAAIT